MESYRFSPGVQFEWNNLVWQVDQCLAGNKLLIIDRWQTQAKIVALAELEQALFSDALCFVKLMTQAGSPLDVVPETVCRFADIEASIPVGWRAIAEWRLEVIHPLVRDGTKLTASLVQERVNMMRQEALKRYGPIPEGKRGQLIQVVSVSSVYRWIRLYLAGGRDLRALIPRVYERGGAGIPRIQPEVDRAIMQALRQVYLRDPTTTLLDAYHEAAAIVAHLNAGQPTDDVAE